MSKLAALSGADGVPSLDVGAEIDGFVIYGNAGFIPAACCWGHSCNPSFVVFPDRLIAGLLCVCSPSSVFGRVISIIVYAVNTVLRRWAWPHIINKRRETIAPARTDFPAFRSVVMESAAARIMAALGHARPDFIHSGAGQPVGESTCFFEAAAAFCAARFKVAASGCVQAATLTSAIPVTAAPSFASIRNNSKHSKCLTSKVNKVMNGGFWYNSSHRHICSPEQYVLVG